jgi:hypothetical protein
MDLIVRLIAKYALWIYILCGLGMIAYLRTALQARKEGIYEIFSLEQANAAKRVYRSSGMIFVLLLIVVGVYILSNYVDLPSIEFAVGETPIPQEETPTPEPTPSLATNEPNTTVAPTATRRPRTTVIVIPTIVTEETPTSQTAPANCPHPNVQVSIPGQNQVIGDGIQVKGTASKEDFDRYEFKFQSRDFEDEWHWVETFTTPVQNAELGLWRTAHLPAGNYWFMLITIDKMGNSEECIVPVMIQH